MKVRELLQTELWSKENHRRILAGFCIGIGLCIVGFVAWDRFEVHWLTSGEREAARAALAEIDSIEAAGPLSDQEWEARAHQVRAKVNASAAAARTYRDTFVEMDLSLYFLKVETDRANLQRHTAGKREIPIDSAFGGSVNDVRAKLHKELD